MTPKFSIITPVFNRAGLLGRTIESCLRQTFPDFEMVVIDDGSSDGSAAVAEGYADERVRVVRHETNRGVSPARNTGVAVARAEWLVFLDSDDELLPDALATISKRASQVGDEIGRMVFMHRLAAGGTTPDPPLEDREWDYVSYLHWTGQIRQRSDLCNCIRRETFRDVRFADDRGLEALYHLDFARRFKTRCHPDIVGVMHHDAPDHLTDYSVSNLLRLAPDNARLSDELLASHGEALRRHVPRRYAQEVRSAANFSFLAGRRLKGARYVMRLMACDRGPAPLGLAIAGFAGPRLYATLAVAKQRLRRITAGARR